VYQPNLYKEIFPYSEVSKIVFRPSTVLHGPRRKLSYGYDLATRQQSRPPYTAEQIASKFQLLSIQGGPNGVHPSIGIFSLHKKDKDAVEKCMALNQLYPEITSWIQCIQDDVSPGQAVRPKETGNTDFVSDYHILLKLNKKRRKPAMND
jgi:hypothetical protein